MSMIFVTGKEIYKAAVAGAKRGYNRSIDDYSMYAKVLNDCYEHHLSQIESPSERLAIWRNTGGDWRKASLPLQLLKVHKHIGGEVAEEHARVRLIMGSVKIFDIPMQNWRKMERNSELVF